MSDLSGAHDHVDLVVHGPPGSAPPVLAKAFVAGLAELGDRRDFHLVPRGDDPGVDAMNLLVTRPCDASILSTCTPVFLQAPLLRGSALTHRALTPLARLVSDHFFLVVKADSPWHDAVSFVAAIRHQRTRTGGYFRGGINHLLALAIGAETGAEIDFIVTPTEPAVWDALIAGDIDWGCGVGAELLPHLERGACRVIAAIDEQRHEPFSHVPSLTELGVTIAFSMWRGLMGPPSLTDAQQTDWHRLIGRVVQTEAWATYLRRNGQTSAILVGDGFRTFLAEQWDWYERNLNRAGLLSSPAQSGHRAADA